MEPRPPKRRLVWDFRWEWLLVPAVLALAAWFVTGAQAPVLTFDDLLLALGAKPSAGLRSLVVLGLLLIGITWIARVWKGRD